MRADDAEEVAALIRLAFAAQPVPLDPPPSALRVAPADVVAHFAGGQGGVVAESAGRVIGSVLWGRQDQSLHLSRLAVDPRFRRSGLARRLLAAAETAARDVGLAELTLGTRLALAGNRALFAAAGFREEARRAHPGFANPTRVELRKRLV